jgi:hypothetical protein
MPASRLRKLVAFAAGGLVVVGLIFAAVQCETQVAEACPVPSADSREGQILSSVRSQAGFPVLYPCNLPYTQRLDSATVVGNPGRQSVTLVFVGTFDLTIRQSQFPPAFNPDPAGVSRTRVDLLPDARATFLQRNDGSAKAQYHLLWKRGGIYFEVQAIGPPLQQRHILNVASSLK